MPENKGTCAVLISFNPHLQQVGDEIPAHKKLQRAAGGVSIHISNKSEMK